MLTRSIYVVNCSSKVLLLNDNDVPVLQLMENGPSGRSGQTVA